MDYGIKVTKDGKNVTSNDPRDYLMWSKYFLFKVRNTITMDMYVPWNAGVAYTDYYHRLGYVPVFQGLFKLSWDSYGRVYRIPGGEEVDWGGVYEPPIFILAWADSEKIRVKIKTDGNLSTNRTVSLWLAVFSDKIA